MSRKKKDQTTEELPAMTGAGVSPLVIEEIDKAVRKYEKHKNARRAESPGEVAAKRDLTAALKAHRDELHTNEDGERFYRHDGVDYIIETKLKRRKADDGEDGSTE
jgi:hypothetical protein